MKSNALSNCPGRHNRIFPELSGHRVRHPEVDSKFLNEKYINEGLSCQDIALLIGNITRQGVWKALKRFGIAVRNKNDAIFYENGKRCKVSQGYFWIYLPDHSRANGKYVKRCILVLEAKLGRSLLPRELPHHIDRNRLNDKPENLQEMFKSDHQSLHHKGIHKFRR